ncbi:MAG: RNA-binding S4 domain-containing protein [Gammaproteobacteria bacterium]|nr:RNA-binding S4 domain-containing protein [Gammaproteobacteria bacterium]
MRVDKWLWVARFYKTRSRAKAAVMHGKIQVNGDRIKPAKEIQIGDLVSIKEEYFSREYVVREFREQRGPAKIAQTLYQETEESIARTEEATARQKSNFDSVLRPRAKPAKSDRRVLARLKRSGGQQD